MSFDRLQFIEPFRVEARERVQRINLGLLELEKDPGNIELLRNMMREAHSVKGTATMLGLQLIADVAHRMEDGLDRTLKGQLVLAADQFNCLFKCLDAVGRLVEGGLGEDIENGDRARIDELITETEEIFPARSKDGGGGANDEIRMTKPEVSPADNPPTGEVNLTEDEIRRLASEGNPRPGVEKDKENKKQFEPLPVFTTGERTLRVDIDKLNTLMNISGELLIARTRLKELVQSLTEKTRKSKISGDPIVELVGRLKSVDEKIGRLTEELKLEVVSSRMVPISNLFNIFPRAMRDLAAERNKEISLEIRGEETELDKKLVDELKDPLLHLLRNAVDHGIEEAPERVRVNKPVAGKLTLSAFQRGGRVVIEVADDGRGVDLVRVRERVVEMDLASAGEVAGMADERVCRFLFTPGFTTRDTVSQVSGRGVGLDVVREKVTMLKGTVEISSRAGEGARFTIELPLTLAITECLLVEAGSEVMAIPSGRIDRTVRVNPGDIKKVEGEEAIAVEEVIIPLIRLRNLFGLPRKGIFEKQLLPVVVVEASGKKVGLLVDRLLAAREIVRKPICPPADSLPLIAGATILGSGRVSLILDVPSIVEAPGRLVMESALPAPASARVKTGRRTILLAEDTLSTAALEKNILESAGYLVVIARDGKEAIKKAGQERFDLVITDILMPGMDGFELTARLKKDTIYRNIPVIVVTTRGSDEDKRRGLQAGADAYILKSEFTSEGMLETIERLIG